MYPPNRPQVAVFPDLLGEEGAAAALDLKCRGRGELRRRGSEAAAGENPGGGAGASREWGRNIARTRRGRGSRGRSSEHKMRWSMLLNREALEDAHISRASGVTDAHVLRRKGRLKEQDGLIEFIISLHSTHSPIQVMEKMERWIKEHSEDPMRSTLSRLISSVGRFYTPLPLVRAFHEYDEFASLSRRRYVPPNFAEIRHVINSAQVHAIAEKLALVTFDADGTIYSDGHHIERDNKMIAHIIKLMQRASSNHAAFETGNPSETLSTHVNAYPVSAHKESTLGGLRGHGLVQHSRLKPV
ncbi:hypothetical protein SELMODRAFT_413967 [Selaginella moellendorffii]|uniref:IMP-specific 5'-nucleotidase 1 n=1 Tax=Selaginella moellendorffii TaxID=88036 RepID=D8RR74_SELML|nr:hypothetical protein SELMODRAFT_413967 [Selaginella moellendorffii]